jgi:hypothetical protein
MQKILAPFCLAAMTLLASCGGKKILIYASTDKDIQADETQKTITVADGTGHQEKEMDLGGGAATLNVQSPLGKFTLDASENGLYIINLESDTVVGSYQHVGADNGQAKITQEALKQKLDSLNKLILGQNISAAARNYFIPPGKMVRITSETKAKVFGPFVTIPSDFDAGSVPEVYKFYTNTEVREIIANLSKMAAQ